MVVELNEDTFIMYAIKHYDNANCKGLSEFYDDLKKFKYLKRLLRKARNSDDLKERLILNHIIVIYNIFGVDAATRMLFYRIDRDDWPQLKTYLVFLNYMPENIILADGSAMSSSEIALDKNLIDILRQI